MEFAAKVKNNEVLFSTQDSYSYNWFYPRYRNGGLHERKVTELIIEACKNSKTFFDIGAHIGFFTCVIAKLFPHIHVHSFEMEEKVFELLVTNVQLNKLNNVHMHNCAVSDINGLVCYDKPDAPNEKTAIAENGTSKIKSISLDGLGIVPDVIKIDVEGTELDVLKGMKKVLPKVKALFIEIHPNLYEKGTAEKILEFLKDFRVYEICDHRRRGDPDMIKVESAEFVYNNMLYAFRY